jgi:hypothetical protein
MFTVVTLWDGQTDNCCVLITECKEIGACMKCC